MTEQQRMRDVARSTAAVCLRRGLLQREPCLLCGNDAEMHHPDYAQPRLVLWLCREHHLNLHAGRVVLLAYPHQPAVDGSPPFQKTMNDVLSNWLSRKLWRVS